MHGDIDHGFRLGILLANQMIAFHLNLGRHLEDEYAVIIEIGISHMTILKIRTLKVR